MVQTSDAEARTVYSIQTLNEHGLKTEEILLRYSYVGCCSSSWQNASLVIGT